MSIIFNNSLSLLSQKYMSSDAAPPSKAVKQQQHQQQKNDDDDASAINAKAITGADTNGNSFKDVDALWQAQLQHSNKDDPEKGWYGKAITYWSKVPPTMDGVLGGLSHVHVNDVRESRQFIESIGKSVQRTRAIDCGAGIGRLTKTLLLPLGFAKVDLMEPLPHMVEQAEKDLAEQKDSIGDFFMCSMQQAKLQPNTYDLILVQWAAIYLTDDDFVSFLEQCAAALRPGGVIFVKENCMAAGVTEFLVDCDDSSLTRSDAHYKLIFGRAKVKILKEANQKNWPSTLFPVKMYALQP